MKNYTFEELQALCKENKASLYSSGALHCSFYVDGFYYPCLWNGEKWVSTGVEVEVGTTRVRGFKEVENEPGVYYGRADLLGCTFSIYFIRVADRIEGHPYEQLAHPECDPYNRLNDVHCLDEGSGIMQTAEIPGLPGRYLCLLIPMDE